MDTLDGWKKTRQRTKERQDKEAHTAKACHRCVAGLERNSGKSFH